MQNQAYWTTRAEQVILGNEKTAAEYEAQLKKAYQKTITQINKDVSSFYGKYAKNNEISLPEAKQRLSPPDLKNFQQQQKEYIAEIESMENPEFSKSYIAKLKTMSGKAYVTKMDEIKANIQHGIETLSTGFNTNLGNTLKIGYQDTFYKDLFEMDKAFGVAVDFTTPGGKQLEKAIKTKWLGENYSDRIWKNKTALTNQLDQLLAQEFVRGKGPGAVAKVLSEKLGVDYNKAVRLIRTEMNFISNQATLDSYTTAGIDSYQYVATLDGKTSDICIDLDDKIFKLQDALAGINLPPMHPHCRSTTIPYFEDDDIGEMVEDRVARDENGKTIKLGANVSYKEWVNKYASSDYVKKIHPELLSEALTLPGNKTVLSTVAEEKDLPDYEKRIQILKDENLFDNFSISQGYMGTVPNAALYEKLGIGGTPTIVEKLPSGITTQYRGIGTDKALEYFEQLKSGKMYCASGSSGNGICMSLKGTEKDKELALNFATGGGEQSGVLAMMGLSLTAKRISYSDLAKLREEFSNSPLKRELLKHYELQVDRLNDKMWEEGLDKATRKQLGDQMQGFSQMQSMISSNEQGVVAVLNGYDACDSVEWGETIVFNRSKLFVEREATTLNH